MATHLDNLDPEQHAAATHEGGPLRIVAGAGTGKTRTLVARVAHLVRTGTPPERILLLTFTRRAARDMLGRARSATRDDRLRRVRGGTFHSVAHATLHRHGATVGLHPGFTLLDEADVRDLVGVVRADSGHTTNDARFPRAEAIVAIASRVANAREPLSDAIETAAPWCREHADAIREILRDARARKQAMNAVDFDDLLLYWSVLLADDATAQPLRDEFDHVLVDEYQDTNSSQASILGSLVAGHGQVTVVGDDAQAIYGFRAATVDNIRRFTDAFPDTTTITLTRNYRSTQPVLDLANAILDQAESALPKQLRSQRDGRGRPRLITTPDEAAQSSAVCDAILELRERGVPLREQAVLVRTGHHSAALELELSRRDIPFVKFGGLNFLQAAHIKDLAAMLRVLDNPADELAWYRVLLLVDGIGPATARDICALVGVGDWQHGDPADASPLSRFLRAPVTAAPRSSPGLEVLRRAWTQCRQVESVADQLAGLAPACAQLWPRHYDDTPARLADLDRLATLAGESVDRGRFLADLTLEPPSSTSDLAGAPHLDDDWLTISTIHSAKGLEWSAVHLIHAADGNIPSDMALRSKDELEEERRLLYVAVTRARDELHVHFPLRYHIDRFGSSSRHGFAQLSRFLAPITEHFDQDAAGDSTDPADDTVTSLPQGRSTTVVDKALDALWSA